MINPEQNFEDNSKKIMSDEQIATDIQRRILEDIPEEQILDKIDREGEAFREYYNEHPELHKEELGDKEIKELREKFYH